MRHMFTVFCEKAKRNWKFYILLCQFLATLVYLDVLIQSFVHNFCVEKLGVKIGLIIKQRANKFKHIGAFLCVLIGINQEWPIKQVSKIL